MFDINDNGEVNINIKNRDYLWKQIKRQFGVVGGSQSLTKFIRTRKGISVLKTVRLVNYFLNFFTLLCVTKVYLREPWRLN